jgi:hypothetical protein
MKKVDFIQRVLSVMNERSHFTGADGQMFGADSVGVDRLIETSYGDAWRMCVNARGSQRNWFENKSFKENAEIHKDLSQGTGFVKLPKDFYLLSSFKMKGWLRPVHEASIVNDLVQSIQSNEYTRGSRIRPVVTIDLEYINYPEESEDPEESEESKPKSGIYNVLKYYSLPQSLDNHEIEHAIYVPVPKLLKDTGDNDDIGLSPQVLEPMIYITGSGVFTLMGKYKEAEALSKMAIDVFPGLMNVNGTMRQ